MRAIKSNMKDQTLTGDKRILYCPGCGAEYSGNAGDYFLVPDDHVFHCQDCFDINDGKVELELVDKIIHIEYRG